MPRKYVKKTTVIHPQTTKPNDRVSDANIGLRAKDAALVLGLSVSMIYKLLAEDDNFPKGSKLGACRVWKLKDLDTWYVSRKGAK